MKSMPKKLAEPELLGVLAWAIGLLCQPGCHGLVTRAALGFSLKDRWIPKVGA